MRAFKRARIERRDLRQGIIPKRDAALRRLKEATRDLSTGTAVDWRSVRDATLAESLTMPVRTPRRARLQASTLALVMHPRLHTDSLTSPLMADPEDFWRPFVAAGVINDLGHRRDAVPGDPLPAGRDIIVVAPGNFNFVEPVEDLIRAHGREVHRVDLRNLELLGGSSRVRAAETVLLGEQYLWDDVVRATFGGAAIVFAEWIGTQAVILSHCLPPGPRLLLRLHSYELLTMSVASVNWDRVDGVIVPSPLMIDVVRRVGLIPDHVPVHPLSNLLDASGFEIDKEPAAQRRVALVGWRRTVKDPAFALRVFRLVRAEVPDATLLLVGAPMEAPEQDQAGDMADYRRHVAAEVADLVAQGAVELTGHVDDVPAVMRRVGHIISTSLRESFHQGLVEGAASGAVATCREWPFMAPYGGPAVFLPQRWVVPDEASMAARIVGFMRDEEAWEAERRRCREEGVALAGGAADRDRWLDLLFGSTAPAPSPPVPTPPAPNPPAPGGPGGAPTP